MRKIVLFLFCLVPSVFSLAQAPANDECSGALAVTPSPDANPGTSVISNNSGATQSMTGCFGAVQNDVWFKFTATSTRHRVNILTTDKFHPWLEVFSGSCGALKSLGCWEVGTSGVTDSLAANLINLTPGATYYFRIYSPFNNIVTNITSFVTTLPTDAANNECSGAMLLSVNADDGCTNVYSGNLEFATQSRPSCVSSGREARDLWFKFVATSASHKIIVKPFRYDNYVFEVFSGTCNSLTSIACVNTGPVYDPDIAVVGNLVAGNTYYIRLYDYSGGSAANQEFSICISTSSKISDNDDCGGAQAVIPSAGNYPGRSVATYIYGATQSMPACFGTDGNDIWFKFTATTTRHKVEASVNTSVVPVLEVFSGTCGALQSLVCRSANSSNSYVNTDLSNLTPGATYYYRTYGIGNSGRITQFTTYILTPSGPALPITMAEFTVKSEKEKNVLLWRTLTETNNSGFELQYSRDGIRFDSLHFVASNVGSQNSNVTQNYRYDHDVSSIDAGKLYYRLKQIDNNLSYQYSKVISADVVSKQNISIRPNLVGNNINVHMPITKRYRFVIYDYVGKICKQGVLQNNTIQIPELKSGMYNLQLKNDNGGVVVLNFFKL